jgi:hypothetical protein
MMDGVAAEFMDVDLFVAERSNRTNFSASNMVDFAFEFLRETSGSKCTAGLHR